MHLVDGLLGRVRQPGDGLDGEPFGQGSLNELFFILADAIGSWLGGEGLVAVFAAPALGAAAVLSPLEDGLRLLAVGAGYHSVIHALHSTSVSTQEKR